MMLFTLVDIRLNGRGPAAKAFRRQVIHSGYEGSGLMVQEGHISGRVRGSCYMHVQEIQKVLSQCIRPKQSKPKFIPDGSENSTLVLQGYNSEEESGAPQAGRAIEEGKRSPSDEARLQEPEDKDTFENDH